MPLQPPPPDLDENGRPVLGPPPPDLDEQGNPVSASPSFLDKLGGWKGVAAGGTRALSSLLATPGGWEGAGVSGLGEGAAEWIEGSKLDPARIATEAGFGAIPFKGVVKAGELGLSALRSGLLGAAHAATSDTINKYEQGATGTQLLPDVGPTAVAGGIGALLGGVGSKWAGKAAAAGKPSNFEVEPTAHTGPDTMVLGKKGAVPSIIQKPLIKGTGAPDLPEVPEGAGNYKIPYSAEAPDDYRASAKAATKADAIKAKADEAKALAEEAQLRIQQQIDEGRLVAGDPNIRETVVPGGTKLSSSTPYEMPAATRAVKAPGITREAQLSGDIGVAAPPPDIPASAPSEGSSSLARFFKSPVDAAGQNFRDAKAAVGENPLAKQQAGVALQQEADKAGLPVRGKPNLEKFLQNRVSPDLDQLKAAAEAQPPAAPAIAPEDLNDVGGRAAAWRREQGLKPLSNEAGSTMGGEAGFALSKLLGGGAGALIGAPVNSMANPDDPNAALKGALMGGALGYGGMSGALKAQALGRGAAGGAVKELTQYRNAGLLSGIAQAKKPLSDLGAMVSEGMERLMTPGRRQQGADIIKELLRVPTNVKNYGAALKHPELGGEVIGDALSSNAPREQGLLGMVGRPFGAAQYASQQILERAGIPLEEARRILYLGNPSDTHDLGGALSQAWLNLQDPQMYANLMKKAGMTQEGGMAIGRKASGVVKAVRPFARISTNLFAQGLQSTPGISMMTGDPETKFARTLIGTGAWAAGGAAGAMDKQAEAAGEDPTSSAVRGLRRAALAKYALPFIAGEAMFGPRGIRDFYYAVPGINAVLEPPNSKDTAMSYGGKQIRNWLRQMTPGVLEPTAEEKIGR